MDFGDRSCTRPLRFVVSVNVSRTRDDSLKQAFSTSIGTHISSWYWRQH